MSNLRRFRVHRHFYRWIVGVVCYPHRDGRIGIFAIYLGPYAIMWDRQ